MPRNNSSSTENASLNIYSRDVPHRLVAESFLRAELPNILGRNIRSDIGTADEALAALSDDQIFRLLESISYSYRMNGVFEKVTDQSYDWLDVELPIQAITLTGKNHISTR